MTGLWRVSDGSGVTVRGAASEIQADVLDVFLPPGEHSRLAPVVSKMVAAMERGKGYSPHAKTLGLKVRRAKADRRG